MLLKWWQRINNKMPLLKGEKECTADHQSEENWHLNQQHERQEPRTSWFMLQNPRKAGEVKVPGTSEAQIWIFIRQFFLSIWTRQMPPPTLAEDWIGQHRQVAGLRTTGTTEVWVMRYTEMMGILNIPITRRHLLHQLWVNCKQLHMSIPEFLISTHLF